MFFRDESGRPIIILDSELPGQPRLQRCVMAEEIGHYYTCDAGSFMTLHFSANAKLAMTKSERAALEWATENLIPTEALAGAVRNGITEVDELADHFGVTTWMIHRKRDILRAEIRENPGYSSRIPREWV